MNETTDRFTGTKIKIVLMEQGRRQDWLANQVGVSQSTVTRWLKGELPIRSDHATKIAQVLGVPFGLLFESLFRDESSRQEAA